MSSRTRYRITHRSPAPAGWRVRSTQAGEHVIRIAFPPGRRRKGSGKVVEVLHPKKNPSCEEGSCEVSTKNPAELLIFGNPSPATPQRRTTRRNAGTQNHKHGCQCFACKYQRGKNSRRGNPTWSFHVTGTKITVRKSFPRDGAAAEEFAKELERKHGGHVTYSGRTGGGTKKRRKKSYLLNPGEVSETEQSVQLFETFHGRESEEIVRKQVSDAMRKDYTALGDLVSIGFDDCGYGEDSLATKWDKCHRIDFTKGDAAMLASSPNGKQLYVIGGNQDVSACLKMFDDVDESKDLIDMGEIFFVVYHARKIHTSFEPTDWCHKFGAVRPRLMFNRLQQQIFFVGGEYFIDTSESVSPGIEG